MRSAVSARILARVGVRATFLTRRTGQPIGAPPVATPAPASPDAATAADAATQADGEVSLPAPGQPQQPTVTPEPAPDPAASSHLIAVPAGTDVHVLPVHPAATLAVGKSKIVMN